MGIIGLQALPADLSCKDALFQYPKGKKLDFVNPTMDMLCLGTVLPCSKIRKFLTTYKQRKRNFRINWVTGFSFLHCFEEMSNRMIR